LAEAMLDVAVTAAREAHGISKPQACSIVGADRSAMRYRHRRGSGWTNSSGTPTDGQKFRILVVVAVQPTCLSDVSATRHRHSRVKSSACANAAGPPGRRVPAAASEQRLVLAFR
jgi:hypothetical protein